MQGGHIQGNTPQENRLWDTNLTKVNKKSLIDQYNCKEFYPDLQNCIKEKENEKLCREHFIKIGECVIKGMKEEEKKLSNIF